MNPAPAELDSRASDWIARRDRGLSPREEQAFQAWLRDPAHAAALARCEGAWQAFPRLNALPADRIEALLGPRRRRLAPLIAWGGAALAAAAAVMLAFVSTAAQPLPDAPRAVMTYAAPAGAELRVLLPDQSVAVLHRGSELAYGATASGRRVRLLAGEAHFTVGKSSSAPFFVHAGSVTVRDIGTAFNVRLASDQVAVLVTEGSVEVSAPAAGPAGAPAPRILTLGQQALVATGAPSPVLEVRESEPTERAQALAWKSKRLTFDRTRLADAIAELNRYNARQLVLGDPSLGDTLIAGGVQADNLDAFVRLLESGFGLAAEARGGEIVLRAR